MQQKKLVAAIANAFTNQPLPRFFAALLMASSSALLATETLPELASPGKSGMSFRPGTSGLALDSNDTDSRFTARTETSRLSGTSVGVQGAWLLTDRLAFGGGAQLGGYMSEVYANLGLRLSATQRLMFTGGQLRQKLEFDFPSGKSRAEMTQNSGGISWRFDFGNGLLDHAELNAYAARTASRDLSDATYAIDTATLYELWNDPRRIAGGRIGGVQGKVGIKPWEGGRVSLGLGHESLRYDLLTGAETHNRATASLGAEHALNRQTRIKFGVDTAAAQNRYTVGLDHRVGDLGTLGVNLLNLHGRNGAPGDTRVQLSWTIPLGERSGATGAWMTAATQSAPAAARIPAAPQAVQWGSNLLDQVAARPAWMPSQVIAKRDTTATQTRLVAVDKTALPAGASIDPSTGAITAPLGIAVTGIASVTRNGAAFANTGQFALSGNSLVIDPQRIEQPAVGVTDVYVVTVNNLGGGTSNVTINVSRGSVKIDSIVVAAGGADVTAPTTTAGPSISVAATDTTASVTQTINENGTGYYLVLPAAAAVPTVAAVKAGTAFAMTAATPAVVSLTGLTASTAYKYYFVAKDSANNDQAAVSAGLAITTTAAADTTPPATTAGPSISVAATDTTASVTQTINENGTGYYLVLPAAAAVPTVAAVKAGTSFAMTAATPTVVALTGLTASTAYKYYFVAKDSANNNQAAVSAGLAITTTAAADVTAPTTTAGPSISVAATATTASVTQTINENGTGYYLVLPAAAAVPTVAAVKAGTAFAMTAATPAVVALTGLTPSTAYKYYFIAKDSANNDQAAVSAGLAITTTAAADVTPPPTPATLTLTGNAGASAGFTNSQSLALAVAAVADPSGVSWFVSESSSAPVVGDAGWSSTQPTSFTLSAGQGTHNVYVYVKDNVGNLQATGKSAAITLDTVATTTLTWVSAPDTKLNAYTALQFTTNDSIVGGTITSVTSSAGGTIANIAIVGGKVQFDWTTPNAASSNIRVQGKDAAGNAFDITVAVNLPNI